MTTVMISGVSSGLGAALAEIYLKQGCAVWGLSRRRPPSTLLQQAHFQFLACDLSAALDEPRELTNWMAAIPQWDLAILNAGILGRIADLRDLTLAELRQTCDVNLWANKLLVDRLAQAERGVKQVVMISSGAAVQGNRGWGGYSLSKAALNMLTRLYAAELPETFFTAVAPGLIETAMQVYLTKHPDRDRFTSLQNLHSKWGTAEMPPPAIVAQRLARLIPEFPRHSRSGEFVDIRLAPWAELSREI